MNHLFLLLGLLVFQAPAFALPEASLRTALSSTILPFLASGKTFTFKTSDGLELSAISFIHPGSDKTIVVLNGRTEMWLKYGEIFYDLYQKGYSIYSYDHRGQGLSPHLSNAGSEVGYVRHYESYIHDLNTFVVGSVLPNHKPGEHLYLLAHSMGGAIAAGYLSTYAHPFERAVLSSPMLEINTKPYPEPIARGIVDLECLAGRGQQYAIGQKDYNPNEAFADNGTTGSENRFWMENQIYQANPKTILGGPSNRWVLENLKMSHAVLKEMKKISIPFLMFQANDDQVVKLGGENTGCSEAGALCTLVSFANAQHEILNEADAIRDVAFEKIEAFF